MAPVCRALLRAQPTTAQVHHFWQAVRSLSVVSSWNNWGVPTVTYIAIFTDLYHGSFDVTWWQVSRDTRVVACCPNCSSTKRHRFKRVHWLHQSSLSRHKWTEHEVHLNVRQLFHSSPDWLPVISGYGADIISQNVALMEVLDIQHICTILSTLGIAIHRPYRDR